MSMSSLQNQKSVIYLFIYLNLILKFSWDSESDFQESPGNLVYKLNSCSICEFKLENIFYGASPCVWVQATADLSKSHGSMLQEGES